MNLGGGGAPPLILSHKRTNGRRETSQQGKKIKTGPPLAQGLDLPLGIFFFTLSHRQKHHRKENIIVTVAVSVLHIFLHRDT